MQASKIIPFRASAAPRPTSELLLDAIIDTVRADYSDRPVPVLAEAVGAARRILGNGGSYVEAIDVAEAICRSVPVCHTEADRNHRRLKAWRERRLRAFLDQVCRVFDDLFPGATPSQRHTAITRARDVLEKDGPLSAALLAARY